MPGLEKNRIYRAHIDGYSSEGLGIARISLAMAINQFVWGAIQPIAGAVAAALCIGERITAAASPERP